MNDVRNTFYPFGVDEDCFLFIAATVYAAVKMKYPKLREAFSRQGIAEAS